MTNSPWANYPKDVEITVEPKNIPDSEKSYTFIFHSEDEKEKFKNLYASLILEYTKSITSVLSLSKMTFTDSEKCIMTYMRTKDQLLVDDKVETGYFRLSIDGKPGIGWQEYALPEPRAVPSENTEKYKSSISKLLDYIDDYKM